MHQLERSAAMRALAARTFAGCITQFGESELPRTFRRQRDPRAARSDLTNLNTAGAAARHDFRHG
jgi:hypothetical protein